MWITISSLVKNRQQSKDYRLIRDTKESLILTNVWLPEGVTLNKEQLHQRSEEGLLGCDL